MYANKKRLLVDNIKKNANIFEFTKNPKFRETDECYKATFLFWSVYILFVYNTYPYFLNLVQFVNSADYSTIFVTICR